MHRANRRGVTRIEVLAVIIVLGFLMTLLLPLMGCVREPARRIGCANNLHELSLATLQYEMVNKSFPGFRNPPLHQENMSWAPMLLPFLERGEPYQQLKKGVNPDGKGPFMGTYLRLLLCPSNPPNTLDASSTPLAYVANSGRFNNYPRQACDGVFLDQVPSYSDPANPEPVKVSLDYIVKHDGAGNTLMYAERLYCYPAASSPPTLTAGDYRLYDNESMPTQEGRVAFSWVTTAGAKVSDHISSRHGDGANVVFCDSRVKFLSDIFDYKIDYEVYQQLMTPDGAGAGVTRAIKDTDY